MQTGFRLAVLFTVSAGFALSSCSGTDDSGVVQSPADFGGVNLPDELPDGQQQAFADGVITRSEYEQAMRAFVACGQGDVFLQGNDGSDVFMLYGSKDDIGTPGHETDTVAGRCYRDTVSWIELVFSATSDEAADEGEQDTREFIQGEARFCLEKHGIEIPEPLETSDFSELLDKLTQLEKSGQCTDDSLIYEGEPTPTTTDV